MHYANIAFVYITVSLMYSMSYCVCPIMFQIFVIVYIVILRHVFHILEIPKRTLIDEKVAEAVPKKVAPPAHGTQQL